MKKLKYALIYVLSLVLAVALTLVGTVAFLQDEEGSVNVMTVGNVYIEQIEQERDQNGNLVPFTQAKPAYPAVGPIAWADSGVMVNGTEYKMFTPELKNVVDKIVTVKNTGKSEAYVRTIIAYECPDYDPDGFLHINQNIEGITTSDWICAEINGVEYCIMVYTYNEALKPGEESAPSLLQVFLDSKADNEYCDACGDTFDILVMSQAVQTNGFNDPKTALDAAFGAISQNNIANLPWDANFSASSITKASNDEAFAAAINRNDAVIVIDLEKDVNFNVSDAYIKVGGEDTEKIIINGNGNTLNLYTTYWSRINTVNPDAVLVLNNVNVTSTQTSGTWDSYDLTFVCEVEANNVTFLKAVALENDATFNNVKILERNGDYYALWITAEGQTVTLNNVEINTIAATKASASIATQGRGIKIDDQYVEDPAKVTLNVNGAKFTTGKKAAIMVKTTGGAEINLKNVDILGVKADFVNPVWIDEDLGADAASCAKIVVNGGSKIVEGEAITEGYDAFLVTDPSAAAETFKNVTNGDVVYFGSGVYPMTNLQGKEVTIIGNGETAIEVKLGGGEGASGNFDGSVVVFENIVFNTDSKTYTGYARMKAIYKNCTFNGTYCLYDDSEFYNCTFNVSGDVYNLWTWGAPNVTLEDCTFNSDGKAVLLYGGVNTNLVVNGCTFNDKGGLTDKKAAIEVGNDYKKSYTLTVNNTVVNGYEINDKGTYTGTTIYGNKNSMPADKLVVTINGVNVSGKVAIASVNDMVAFANAVNVAGNSFSGKTVVLVSNIDLKGINWTPIGNSTNIFKGTFDGNGYVISNLNCVHEGKSDIGLFGMTTDGHIKNVTVENAIVTGRLNVGVVAGTPYTSKYTNITVKGHVEVNGMAYVGAVGGKNCYANWDQITVNVDGTSYVKANSVENGKAYRTYVGGVIGFMGEGSHTVSNVNSNIDVIGSTIDVGGIAGIAHYGNNFVNVTCSGDVTLTGAMEAADAEEMGGIAGVWHNGGSDVTFENCTFTGTLSANIKGVDLSDNTIVGKAYSASGSGNLIIK